MTVLPRARRALAGLYLRPTGAVGQVVRAATLIAGTWPPAAARVLRRRGRVVLVHQPGKVASLAIVTALRSDPEVDGRWAVFHTHLLSPSTRRDAWRRRLRSRWAPRRTWAESAFLSLLLRSGVVRPVIITVVRDPFEAHASAFLQNPEMFVEGFVPGRTRIADIPTDDLVRAFREQFPHAERLGWYDREIRDLVGLDPFATDPDRSGPGWSVVRGRRATVCTLRYDRLAEAFPQLTEDVFGRRVTLTSVNRTADKGHGEALEVLRRRSSYGEELTDLLDGSELATWLAADRAALS